jgi:hypothetical protein
MSYEITGWAEENESFCCGLLVVYAVVTNFLAILVMYLKKDNYAIFRTIKDFFCVRLTHRDTQTVRPESAFVAVDNNAIANIEGVVKGEGDL